MEGSMVVLKKFNVELLHDSAIPLLDTNPKQLRAETPTGISLHPCLWQHYLQKPKGGSDPSVH